MIISASRRTDIPAYFSEWFFKRIEEGFVWVQNPMYPRQISEIPLSPEHVDCIVFWTKNPKPMINQLQLLNDLKYNYYFQFTLTGYGKDLEQNLPDKKDELIPTFQRLAEYIGKERVIWRYDPIVFNAKYSEEYHLRAFQKIAEALHESTEKCVISFVDIYKRNKKRIESIQYIEHQKVKLIEFAKQLTDIASKYNLVMAACAEDIDLSYIGIERNHCIDENLIKRIIGHSVNLNKDKTQRKECGCVESIDIGTYNTCSNGCIYCYANYNVDNVKENADLYDIFFPALCVNWCHPFKITARKGVKSSIITSSNRILAQGQSDIDAKGQLKLFT